MRAPHRTVMIGNAPIREVEEDESMAFTNKASDGPKIVSEPTRIQILIPVFVNTLSTQKRWKIGEFAWTSRQFASSGSS